jgi:hypothetical protein
MNHASPIRAPSGYVPLILAGAAVALLVGYLVTGPHPPNTVVDNGVLRPDEGAAARLWQLLMLLQLPLIVIFAARWLPRDPKRALPVLALQLLAFAGAALPVFVLEM